MLRILLIGLVVLTQIEVSAADPRSDNRYLPRDKQEITMSFAPLVKRTAPAVVNVYAKTIERQQTQAQGGPFDDPDRKSVV